MKDQDQYDEKVPTLYLIGHLPYPEDESIVKRIVNADWYEVAINQSGGEDEPTWYLMANAKQLEPLEDIDLDIDYWYAYGVVSVDLGGIVVEVLKVNDVLKRWSVEDGFYSA